MLWQAIRAASLAHERLRAFTAPVYVAVGTRSHPGFRATADALVPPRRGWWWNQAMLDFGALVCLKRAPRCESCVVRSSCAWRGSGADPAIGSASVGVGQSRFAGSDRQGRGRLVDALRRATVAEADLAMVMGWPNDDERARRVAATVVADGLAERAHGVYFLP